MKGYREEKRDTKKRGTEKEHMEMERDEATKEAGRKTHWGTAINVQVWITMEVVLSKTNNGTSQKTGDSVGKVVVVVCPL